MFSCGEIRASILLLGAMLGRFGKVCLRLPGGCNLGPRPIDYHIDIMRQFGATVQVDGQLVVAKLERLAEDRSVHFAGQTVTGTVNAILCALGVSGQTEIHGCVLEPEVDDFIAFVSALGAQVNRMGSLVVVRGGTNWQRGNFRIMADRIEAGTFMIMAAAIQGRLVLEDLNPKHLEAVIQALRQVGADVEVYQTKVVLTMNKRPRALDLVADQYPAFPTDLQPQWCVLSSISSGRSLIKDRVFDKRMDHVEELKKMGAKISEKDGQIEVDGVDHW